MSKNDLVAARLELIAAKAKVMAADYKDGRMWDGDLSKGLDDLLREITHVRNERGSSDRNDWQGDR